MAEASRVSAAGIHIFTVWRCYEWFYREISKALFEREKVTTTKCIPKSDTALYQFIIKKVSSLSVCSYMLKYWRQKERGSDYLIVYLIPSTTKELSIPPSPWKEPLCTTTGTVGDSNRLPSCPTSTTRGTTPSCTHNPNLIPLQITPWAL